MNAGFLRSSVLALAVLGIAGAAGAHHPPRFERCKLLTFSGELERIEWSNPHVVLQIRTETGDTEQVGWLNLQRLALEGIDRDSLSIGDYLIVEGGFRTQDTADEPVLLSSIRRPADGWAWSRPPQGC